MRSGIHLAWKGQDGPGGIGSSRSGALGEEWMQGLTGFWGEVGKRNMVQANGVSKREGEGKVWGRALRPSVALESLKVESTHWQVRLRRRRAGG